MDEEVRQIKPLVKLRQRIESQVNQREEVLSSGHALVRWKNKIWVCARRLLPVRLSTTLLPRLENTFRI